MAKDPQEIKDLAGKYSEAGGRGSRVLVVTFSQDENASYYLSGNRNSVLINPLKNFLLQFLDRLILCQL